MNNNYCIDLRFPLSFLRAFPSLVEQDRVWSAVAVKESNKMLDVEGARNWGVTKIDVGSELRQKNKRFGCKQVGQVNKAFITSVIKDKWNRVSEDRVCKDCVALIGRDKGGGRGRGGTFDKPMIPRF